MYYIKPSLLKLTILFCALFSCNFQLNAQIGLKVSYMMPLNAFGKDFKRAPTYEAYYFTRYDKGESRIWGRIGLYYTNLKPRMDTIPVFLIKGNPDLFIPGSLSYSKCSFIGLYIDQAVSAIDYKGFRLDIGLGLLIGRSTMKYTLVYDGILSSDNNIQQDVWALRTRLGASYRLSPHISVFAEAMNSFMMDTEWSSQFHNNSVGLGVHINIKPDDE